jgi:hypothetical protein
MAEIIKFETRQQRAEYYPVIKKQVNGQTFECVDVDALTPAQRRYYFSAQRVETQK